MKKIIKIVVGTIVSVVVLSAVASCGNSVSVNPPVVEDDEVTAKIKSIYYLSGYSGTYEEWLESIKGAPGVGISNIDLESSTALTNTYTITLTNGTKKTFTVNNGNGVEKIEKTNTEELVDTYTITYTNGTTSTFTVTNGAAGAQGIQGVKGEDGHTPVITISDAGNWVIDGVDTLTKASIKGDTGNGISSIELSSTVGLVDTYTITYTNGTTTTFTVTNGSTGSQGIQGIQGIKGNDGHTPVITIGENGNWVIDGVDTLKPSNIKGDTGNGISSIKKTDSDGLIDTYTITFTNGTTTSFVIKNGEKGDKGEDGHTPEIVVGTNGNWIIDGVDTGIAVYQPKEEFTVTFDSGVENIILSNQKVTDGSKLVKPVIPKRLGYEFDGWYYEGEKWSFAGYVVTENMTLTAKWVEAKQQETEGLEFELDAVTNTYKVVDYKGSSTEVFIPTIHNGLYVTEIADYAFGYEDRNDEKGNIIKRIKSIYIPEGIEKIGKKAFSKITSLKTVTLPSTLKEISSDAFYDAALVEVINKSSIEVNLDNMGYEGKLPITYKTSGESDIVEIDNCLFYTYDGVNYLIGYTGNKNVIELPMDYKGKPYEIGVRAFYENFYSESTISKIVIPEGITTIGGGAFRNLGKLNTLVIPATVKRIEEKGLSRNGLKSVYIPASVTYIGSLALSDSIKDIYFDGTKEDWDNIEIASDNDLTKVTVHFASQGLNFVLDEATDTYFVSGYNGLDRDIVIPSTYNGKFVSGLRNGFVDYVEAEDQFHWNDYNVDSVTLPYTIKTLGEKAFYGLSSVHTIVVPESVTYIDPNAFYNCLELVEIINNTNIKLQGDLVNNEDAYYPITVHKSTSLIENVDGYLFYSYNGENYLIDYIGTDRDIVLPKDYNSKNYHVGARAFYKVQLDNVVLSSGVIDLGRKAFYGCGMTSVTFNDNLTAIGDSCFRGNKLVEVIIPDSVKTIGKENFRKMDSLLKVKLPNGLEVIEELMFASSHNINELVIPSSVVEIKTRAFESVKKLNDLVIPEGVTTLGQRAFYGFGDDGEYDHYNNLYLPSTLKSVGDMALKYLGNTTIYYNGSENDFNKIKFGADNSVYLHEIIYLTNTESEGVTFTLDEKTNRYYVNGFVKDSKNIIIPDLYNNLPVVGIADNPVENTSDLKYVRNVKLSNALLSIGAKGLSFVAISTVTIPQSVVKIDDEAFTGCMELVEIINLSKAYINPSIVNNSSSENPGKPYYVTIKNEGESDIYSIGDYDFYNINGVAYLIRYNGDETNITLPETTSEFTYNIGRRAFRNTNTNNPLVSVTMPAGIKEIGWSAFNAQKSLKYVVLPENLEYIDFDAFKDCASLESINLPNSLKEINTRGLGRTTGEEVSLKDIYFEGTEKEFNAVNIKDRDLLLTVVNVHFYTKGLTFTLNSDNEYVISKYNGEDLDVVLPNMYAGRNVTTIKKYAFNSSLMTSLVIPEGIDTLEERAIHMCVNLHTVTIPSTIADYYYNSFNYTRKLVDIYNHSSVNTRNMFNYLPRYAVDHETDDEKSNMITVDGFTYLYKDNVLTLIDYTENESETLMIPSQVLIDGAMVDVSVIGENCFYAATQKEIILPNTIKSIELFAFLRAAIRTITIPESVETINYGVFSYAYNLIEIINLSKNEHFNDNSYTYCTPYFYSDKVVDNHITYAENEEYKFALVGSDAILLEYKKTEAEVSVPSHISYEGNYYDVVALIGTFYNNRKVTKVVIPNTVEFMASTFLDCKNLVEVVLPESLRVVGSLLFEGTSKIESVEINSKLEKVDIFAFRSDMTIYVNMSLEDYAKLSGFDRYQSVYLYSAEEPTDTTHKYYHKVDNEIVIWQIAE